MNIYDLTNITRVFFCGGTNTDNEGTLLNRLEEGMSVGIDVTVHPKEIERQKRIGKRRAASRGSRHFIAPLETYKSRGDGKYDNSIIFVSGGFGFGTKDDSFFQEFLGKVNEICKNNNSHVMFVRGSSDDPSYFTGHKFDFSNIKLLEDYSVVKLNGFDCLCVGGSIPIDRKWRMGQKDRIGRSLYFENCNTVFKKEILSKILRENNITCIITSDAPTFISPYVDSSSDSKWIENDESIIRDITEQRMVMDAIYGEMMRFKKKPYVWCTYAKYDDSSTINRIKFIGSASAHSMFNLQEIATEEFGITLNGEKSSSSKSSKRLLKMTAEEGRATSRIANTVGLGHPVHAIDVPNDEPRAPRWYEAAQFNPVADIGQMDDEGRNPATIEVDSLEELRNRLVANEAINQHDLDEIDEFVRRYAGQNVAITIDDNIGGANLEQADIGVVTE